MSFPFILQGIVIGFTLAAVVGPIGLLCIQRTLARGWRVGVASGLGVATADALYGFVGALGLTLVTSFLVAQQTWLRVIGGLVLVYFGGRIFVTPLEARAAAQQDETSGRGHLGDYASIFLLTLSNPATILAFAAVFAGLSAIATGASFAIALTFAAAVFLGSLSWWLVLVTGVSLLRTRFSPGALAWSNRISGALITAFGIAIVASLFF